MNTRTLVFCLAGILLTRIFPLSSSAQIVMPQQSSYDDAAEAAWSRSVDHAGVSLGGTFRSAYLRSGIAGHAAVDSLPGTESVAFTGADISLIASQGNDFGGRAIFRLQQDWSDFFVSAQNSFFTRWISVDGQSGPVSFHAGDFRSKLTPLTLYLPQIGLLYEPEVFSRSRRDAMYDEFIWNNERTFQGIDLNMVASLQNAGVAVLDTVEAQVLGARLRQTEIPNSGLIASTESDIVEKYLVGGRARFVSSNGLSAGVTYLRVIDREDSYRGPRVFDDFEGYRRVQLQNSTVTGLDLGLSVNRLLGWNGLQSQIRAEYANSADKGTAPLDSFRLTSDLNYVMADTVPLPSMNGNALLVRARLAFEEIPFTPGLALSVHYNDPDFVNELTQSPSFLPRRILNYENDTAWHQGNMSAAQYSTFDALYHHVFRFRPSGTVGVLSRSVPGTKNAYSNAVYTRSELSVLEAARFDNTVQLSMPEGPATPNRIGIESLFAASILQRLEFTVLASRFDEVRADSLSSKKGYLSLGAGIKSLPAAVSIFGRPLGASLSYVQSSAAWDSPDTLSALLPNRVVSGFLNLGVQVGILKRTTLLCGYQTIETRQKSGSTEITELQNHAAAGLQYKVRESAFLEASLGSISVDDRSDADRNFSQLITDILLNVTF